MYVSNEQKREIVDVGSLNDVKAMITTKAVIGPVKAHRQQQVNRTFVMVVTNSQYHLPSLRPAPFQHGDQD